MTLDDLRAAGLAEGMRATNTGGANDSCEACHDEGRYGYLPPSSDSFYPTFLRWHKQSPAWLIEAAQVSPGQFTVRPSLAKWGHNPVTMPADLHPVYELPSYQTKESKLISQMGNRLR